MPAGGRDAAPRRWRTSGCGGRTRNSLRNWHGLRQRLKWWEKRTRSWNCSPRARLRHEAAQVIDMAVTELEPLTSVKRACELLGNHGRRCTASVIPSRPRAKHRPGRGHRTAALTAAEQAALLALLDSERFADKSPAQVYAILLDDGIYLASIRTMYRVMTLADRSASAAPRPPIRPGSGPSWSLTARTRLDLGHHQAERTLARHLFRPVRDAGHLLPQGHLLGGALRRER